MSVPLAFHRVSLSQGITGISSGNDSGDAPPFPIFHSGMRWISIFMTVVATAWAASGGLPPVPWPATDSLGRSLPLALQTGPPRADRTVAMFYFLWLGPHAQAGGPWDVTKILAQDLEAMKKPDSPLWGPLHAPHHWGESIFGYYNTDDPYVLRKHAQMLSDAGIDTVVFDVTNQLTYRDQYTALLGTWSSVRADGGRTPQVAFLCPFWQPDKVVRELWRELYEPGHFRNLWFQWEGKPFILADPALLKSAAATVEFDAQPTELLTGQSLGQTFVIDREWTAVAVRVPTWHTSDGALSLTLRRDDLPGQVLARERFERVPDNSWVRLACPNPMSPGRYELVMSGGAGRVGWWSHPTSTAMGGDALENGARVAGGRSLRIEFADPIVDRIRASFTFRAPQPDYFRGPAAPDMWSWLEVHPQHVFRNSGGEKEQMSVGVAQNAVNGRLGSMSESAGARGRSFHGGGRDGRPNAVALGLNFAEQWDRAYREDPRALFITGWNEWIAGRFAEFNGVREPVMFVDQFDHEHSRDIEPMKGGHGDAYYYQLAAAVRHYKGTPALPGRPTAKSIEIAGPFDQWNNVEPAFPDDAGDTAHRDYPGYANHTRYVNISGRNDIIVAKVATQADTRFFYVRTRKPLSPATDPGWMWLLLDADGNPRSGWNGWDIIVNRTPPKDGHAIIERHVEGWHWETIGRVPLRHEGAELHLAIPAAIITQYVPAGPHLDFKWADHMPENKDITTWLDAGDTAPNGRFSYRWEGAW